MFAARLKFRRIASILIVLSTATLVAILAFLVGRPIVTDDLWWSVVLGKHFVAEGPWLGDDPLLGAAYSQPDPSAWLFDSLLYVVGQSSGLQGLRVVHVLLVLLILGAAWRLFRSAHVAPLRACAGLQIFIVLAAYRLCQLRAHLFSMLFVLLLVEALVREKERSLGCTLTISACCAVWANTHAGFVLGPYVVALAVLTSASGVLFDQESYRKRSLVSLRHRLRLLVFVTLASLLNPLGATAYLRPFTPGTRTADLGVVADEWAPFRALTIPDGGLPPSLLSWALIWTLFILLLLATVRVVSEKSWSRSAGLSVSTGTRTQFILAYGLLGLSLIAIRFFWLGVIACLPILYAWPSAAERSHSRSTTLNQWQAAILSGSLVFGFMRFGDWPILAPGTPLTLSGYSEPYSTHKYHAHSIGFVADSGLTGVAFTHYFLSGFTGFWSSPQLKTFINGSMNVAPDRVRGYVRIVRAYPDGMASEEQAILGDYEIDIFVGTGLPIAQDPRTPWRYTTAQLENSDNWRLVFRSARSSVYLRDEVANFENQERLADYYRRAGVPYDPSFGFDTESILDQKPDWAFLQGLIPSDYRQLVMSSTYGTRAIRLRALRRLSLVYAVLGLYERSIAMERRVLAEVPDDQVAMRRLAWSLSRNGQKAELQALLLEMDRHPSLDAFSSQVRDAVQLAIQTGTLTRIASMPLLLRSEASELTTGYYPAKPRDWSDAIRMTSYDRSPPPGTGQVASSKRSCQNAQYRWC